jgi:hypothetical protein
VTVPKPYRKAIAKYGAKLDGYARKTYGISGAALLAKTLAGESNFNMNAVSSADARGAAQFIPGTRQVVISKTGGKIDPWRSPAEAVAGAYLHLSGKLGNAPGLSGYNPGGGQAYVNYILGQSVGGIPEGNAGAKVSLGKSGGETKIPGVKVPGVAYKSGQPAQIATAIGSLPIRNVLATSRPSAGPVHPTARPGQSDVLSYAGAAAQQRLPATEGRLVATKGMKIEGATIPGAQERGGVPAPATGGKTSGKVFSQTKGAWDGSKKVAYKLATGITHGSEKRPYDSVEGPGVSDHFTGATSSYAIDLPAVGAAGNRIVKTLAKRLGVKPGRLVGTFTPVRKGNYIIQILWQVEDHYDHVHLGVRRA